MRGTYALICIYEFQVWMNALAFSYVGKTSDPGMQNHVGANNNK